MASMFFLFVSSRLGPICTMTPFHAAVCGVRMYEPAGLGDGSMERISTHLASAVTWVDPQEIEEEMLQRHLRTAGRPASNPCTFLLAIVGSFAIYPDRQPRYPHTRLGALNLKRSISRARNEYGH